MGRSAGRKRKPGKRTDTNRPSRAGSVPLFDRGTERAQAIVALYGQDGTDCVGRAYRAGLLGEGSDAKAMLDTARRIAKAYWSAYETGAYQCPLGNRTHGGVVSLDQEKIKRREEWLAECLSVVDKMGANVRRAFDQFVINPHPDCGPDWMDRLCFSARTKKVPDVVDESRLRAALDALEILAL